MDDGLRCTPLLKDVELDGDSIGELDRLCVNDSRRGHEGRGEDQLRSRSCCSSASKPGSSSSPLRELAADDEREPGKDSRLIEGLGDESRLLIDGLGDESRLA